jgi:hypothetical protein
LLWPKVAAPAQQLLPNGKFNLQQILPSGQIFLLNLSKPGTSKGQGIGDETGFGASRTAINDGSGNVRK